MDELAKRFAELAEKYGPNVAEAAKSATQIEAYSHLVAGAECLFIGTCLLIAARYVSKQIKKGWNDAWIAFVVVGTVVGIILSLVGAWAFIDPWTWTAINHPELWIAKKAFHL